MKTLLSAYRMTIELCILITDNRMIECLVKEDHMTPEEAMEFIDYNTVRALPYVEDSPIVVYDLF